VTLLFFFCYWRGAFDLDNFTATPTDVSETCSGHGTRPTQCTHRTHITQRITQLANACRCRCCTQQEQCTRRKDCDAIRATHTRHAKHAMHTARAVQGLGQCTTQRKHIAQVSQHTQCTRCTLGTTGCKQHTQLYAKPIKYARHATHTPTAKQRVRRHNTYRTHVAQRTRDKRCKQHDARELRKAKWHKAACPA
jgi:hypothetical protein